jgi:hypothetical protein
MCYKNILSGLNHLIFHPYKLNNSGFVSTKVIILLVDLHFFELLTVAKHHLSKKKNSVSHAPLPPRVPSVERNLYRCKLSPSKEQKS